MMKSYFGPVRRTIPAAVITIVLMASSLFSTPPPPASGYYWESTFSDEFNGTSLDLGTWEPSWFGGTGISNPVNSDEDGCYDAAQVSVSGGMLRLKAESTTNPSCRKRDGSQANYVSGLVNTRNGFLFTYGYFEARIYLPGGNGDIYNWPAFWSDGTGKWPTTGEIDVMESLSGHQPCWHYHYQDTYGNHQGPGGCVNWATPYGWHTFGAHWEPDKITYYYNGKAVGTIAEGIVNAEHFIILNNGINDRYGINVPATVEVDYVRVWQEKEGSAVPELPGKPAGIKLHDGTMFSLQGKKMPGQPACSGLYICRFIMNGQIYFYKKMIVK